MLEAGDSHFSPLHSTSLKTHLTGDWMDRTESIVHNMLGAIEAPLYDVGVLSSRGMLPRLDGIPARARAPPAPQTPQCPRLAPLNTPFGRASLHRARRSRRDLTCETFGRRLRPQRRGRDKQRELSGLAQTRDRLPQASRHVGTIFKHQIAEIHATSMKRLSKIKAADDPADGAETGNRRWPRWTGVKWTPST